MSVQDLANAVPLVDHSRVDRFKMSREPELAELLVKNPPIHTRENETTNLSLLTPFEHFTSMRQNRHTLG